MHEAAGRPELGVWRWVDLHTDDKISCYSKVDVLCSLKNMECRILLAVNLTFFTELRSYCLALAFIVASQL